LIAHGSFEGGPLQAVLLTPVSFHWLNAAGGDWDVGENWSAGQPPSTSDMAEFKLPDTYTVALTAPAQAAAVRVDQGDVTFNLAGHAMELGSVTVGSVPDQSAILRVPDVDNFNAESIVVGGDENAPSALVLGPEGANPAGSGAGDPDGGSVGSGAVLRTRTLFIAHRGQGVVQNVTGEMDVITVRPSDVPVPFPDITDEPARLVIKNSQVHVVEELSILPLSSGDEVSPLKGISCFATSMNASRMKLFANASFKGATLVRTPEYLAGAPPGSIQPPKVTVELLGESVVEILPGGSATIGNEGEAEMQVMDGSTIQAAGADVTVGQNGTGTVEITGQSGMTAQKLTLGMNAGSAGEVSVSSTTGTSTVTAPQINVAEQGSGVLRVEDGGRVDSQTVRVTLPPPGRGSSSDFIASGQDLPDGAGQLIVSGTGLVSAETIDVGMLGEVLGTGTIEVTEGVFNSGKVKPGESPGTLTIIGPYMQTGTGELEIEFSGTLSGQYDVLAVEGNATIDGTVALQFIDGFAPQQGQQFEILTATGLADVSAAVFEVRNLEPGFMFEIMPSATGIMMTALNDGVFVPDTIPGDFNADGAVDAADYVVWRKTGGMPGDYDTWRANFGRTAASGATGSAGAAVPEPGTFLLLFLALVGAGVRRALPLLGPAFFIGGDHS
jgi:T5SS/PEP-CTERM-associated repeat protein